MTVSERGTVTRVHEDGSADILFNTLNYRTKVPRTDFRTMKDARASLVPWSLAIDGCSHVTLVNANISSNIAAVQGGGLLTKTSTLLLESSFVNFNTAKRGAGLLEGLLE